MVTILFVCSANRFRSVIAAEYLRSLVKNDPFARNWNITSAGTWAQEDLAPLPQALKFAQKQDLDLSGVRSKEINGKMLEEATLEVWPKTLARIKSV